MLFRNALIENNENPVDFRIENGRFEEFGKLEPGKGEFLFFLFARISFIWA